MGPSWSWRGGAGSRGLGSGPRGSWHLQGDLIPGPLLPGRCTQSPIHHATGSHHLPPGHPLPVGLPKTHSPSTLLSLEALLAHRPAQTIRKWDLDKPLLAGRRAEGLGANGWAVGRAEACTPTPLFLGSLLPSPRQIQGFSHPHVPAPCRDFSPQNKEGPHLSPCLPQTHAWDCLEPTYPRQPTRLLTGDGTFMLHPTQGRPRSFH